MNCENQTFTISVKYLEQRGFLGRQNMQKMLQEKHLW